MNENILERLQQPLDPARVRQRKGPGYARLTWRRHCWQSCARTTGVAGVDYSAHGAQTGSPGAKPTVTKAFPRDISLTCNVDLATGHLVRFHQERTGNSETIPPQLSEATEIEGSRKFALTDGALGGKIIMTPSASGCTVSLVPNASLARSPGGDSKWPEPDNPDYDPSDPRNRWDGGAVWPADDSEVIVAYCRAFERFLSEQVVEPGKTGSKQTEKPYVFRQSGDMWEIAYTDGKGFHLADLKGLHYIAYLLDNQGKEVSALDLEKSHPDSPDDTQAMQISAAQLDENGLATSSTDDRQPVLDKKAKQEYKDKLESLQDEREQAEQLGDEKRLERINKKTDAISRELNSAQAIFGKSRIFANQNERCRKRVTEAIRTSLVKLRTNHKELGEHLDASIKTGGYCSYTSQEEISWNR